MMWMWGLCGREGGCFECVDVYRLAIGDGMLETSLKVGRKRVLKRELSVRASDRCLER
jgi:hypothetical protein